MTGAIDLRPDHEEQVRQILAEHVPAGTLIWVFGSRAKWTAKPHSDLDLAIEAFERLPSALLHFLADVFEDSDLPFRVDIVDLLAVEPSFRAAIEKNKVAFSLVTYPTVAELQKAGLLLVEDGNHGEYRPRPNEFVESGVAFIRAADMDNGRVLFERASHINETAARRITKGIGRPGDVLLSHKGTVGKVALVADDAPPFVCSPQTTFWRTLDEDRIDRRYLYAFLRSPLFHRQLATRSGETDMAPYVSLTSQRGLHVALPPIRDQRAIGAMVGAIDDKIELNRRMNETLEAMARAIFKDWFVDFGPTRAKMEGRSPYLSSEIWEAFPGSLNDEGLPSGWSSSTVGEQVQIVGGTTPRTSEPSFWDGPHAWATPKDLSRLSVPILISTERSITDAGLAEIGSGLLPKGTVLLSSRAPIGYVAISQMPAAINQGFIAMICKAAISNLNMWLWTMANMELILQHANGSTFLEISKKNFGKLSMLVADASTLRCFDMFIQPIYNRIVANEQESSDLTATRDLLLPELISGEVRIRDAEARVADAA